MGMAGAKTGGFRKPAIWILGAGLGVGVVVSTSAVPIDERPRQPAKTSVPLVSRAVKAGVSPAARTLPAEPAFPAGARRAFGVPNPSLEEETPIRRRAEQVVPSIDGALQGPTRAATAGPTTVGELIGSFEGLSNSHNVPVVGAVLPPDTNGDVGPNHYVQSVNLLVRVFDKTGTPLTPPFRMGSLFADLGGLCIADAGDPIALYDPLADRWLLSQLSEPDSQPHHQCIAISQTSDPTGSYFVYDFEMPTDRLNDYPKFGVWPDGYYMSDNQFIHVPFPPQTTFDGAGVFAFDRVKMLAGDPTASYIYFNLADRDRTIAGILPSDLDGPPPPLGTPNVFAYFIANDFGDAQDGLRLFDFHADFGAPSSSTFAERPESPVSVASFDPGFLRHIPQPPPATATDALDAITDRLMHRLQYRTFGTHATLVTNHTVDADSTAGFRAGVRYYELRQAPLGSAFALSEQATFSPNGNHRWMGSAALDGDGNLCVGYSVSSTTTFPSIAYACRQPLDPPGGLGDEVVLAAGGGSQIVFPIDPSPRWGDYSMLAVDPTDECTFWYTTEYYTGTNSEDEPGGTCGPPRPDSEFFKGICWHTRVGRFRVPSCTGAVPQRGTLTGTVTNAETGAPVAGVLVRTIDGFARATDASGSYSMPVPAGTYDLAASKEHFLPGAAGGLVVSAGNATHQDFALVGLPVVRLDSTSIDEDHGGNGNGWIDPSECIDLTIAVANTGPGSATGSVATLSSPTLGVALSNALSPYPDVAPGALATNTTPFRLQTSAAFHSGRPIHLNLQVKTNEGSFAAALELPTGAFFSASGPVPIPEPTGFPPNPGPPVDLPITVFGINSAISQVAVTLHVAHVAASDLALSLVGPDGTTVVLHRPGSIFDLGRNFGTDCPAGSNDTTFDDGATTPVSAGRVPFVGSFRPEEPLAVFSGMSGSAVNGTWRLRAQDNGPFGGGGSIECVMISFGSAGPGPGGCGGPLIDLNVDFNRDAKTDILWRHPSTGLTGAWFMDGPTRTGTALMTPPVFTDPAWLVVGTRDFNRDGKPDILWRNQPTSRVAVSYMDGLTVTGIAATSPPVLADPDWSIQGTGDFNGDGMPDLLWRNLPTGLIAVTFMNGVAVTAATLTSPPVVGNPDWLIVGIGDFNRDGKPDLLWRNPSTGQILVWFMDGVKATGLAATSPATVAEPDWEIVAVGDYDADDDPDILWRNRTTGQVAIWFMHGVTATSQSATVPPIATPGWKVVGPK